MKQIKELKQERVIITVPGLISFTEIELNVFINVCVFLNDVHNLK